tara:strand:- start:622 stop:1200 length:579 start_codon:yes stop_codon:yes gene_type:complete
MRNVVRELIAERQPHSKYVVEQVNVRQLGIGETKDCFHNACGMAKTDIDKRYKVVSGWLIGEYDNEANGTALIQHYWNYDTKTNEYVDITPNIDDRQSYKYVVDTDLVMYSQQPHIYEVIEDCVGHSMWFSNGKFSLVTKPFLTHIPLSESAPLETKLFYMDFSGVREINRKLRSGIAIDDIVLGEEQLEVA